MTCLRAWNTGAMSKSTPRDLAVAFRSMSRRLRDAQDDDTPPVAVASAENEIQKAITSASAVLGSAATAEAVASAIEARRVSDWSDDELAAIQVFADNAARAIRGVEDLSPRA
jgi:hypothetical protein